MKRLRTLSNKFAAFSTQTIASAVQECRSHDVPLDISRSQVGPRMPLSSTGTVTSFYFDWDATRVGVYLAVLGLLMFPANLIVAIMSRSHEDRAIVVGIQIMVLMGTTAIIGYVPDAEYSVYHYISATVCCFLGTNMLEAPIMSILSKTIPPQWAKGTFNSGLLATEAGTFGRVLGDVIISLAGLAGIDRILDLTFVPMTVLMVGTLLITLKSYAQLETDDDEDD